MGDVFRENRQFFQGIFHRRAFNMTFYIRVELRGGEGPTYHITFKLCKV